MRWYVRYWEAPRWALAWPVEGYDEINKAYHRVASLTSNIAIVVEEQDLKTEFSSPHVSAAFFL